jgi:uncharacterized protein (DUF433 family)
VANTSSPEPPSNSRAGPSGDGDQAAAWRPDANVTSPVGIRPDVRFGRPAIKGISTAAIWEQADAGETAEELDAVFGLAFSGIRWALSFENAQRAQQDRSAA